ncbi:uncharacterized protein LOC122079227 [Macadamia integrifolia]|uniref:uncharacterized protein LOC122079227 n=1 Tax=Macadamia integrifolia TaxID=60698 RepID=UPI001C4F39F8|nr:uncharacterized protein LOC122079227 [Macadamia integrifolia]
MAPLPGVRVFVEPVFCPQAISDWYACGSRDKKKEIMESGNVKSGEMSLRAKKHLSAAGWEFSHVEKKGRNPELRYKSPKGRYYHSLRLACLECMKDLGLYSKDITARTDQMPMQSMAREDGLDGALLGNRKRRNPSDQDVNTRKFRKGKGNPSDQDVNTRKFRKGKGIVVVAEHQHIEKLAPPCRKPRCILSFLIDMKAVLPDAKVYYKGQKGHQRMKEGKLTRDGISCDCCQNLFTLSGFEAHAGSTYRRPAASIVLEDGRSLLECRMQILYKTPTLKTHERVRSCLPEYKSDYICSICHYGGELLLCDRCPSVFHLSCLGLKDLPEGKWFCPSCRCGICGQSEFDGNDKEFTATMALHCDQCRRGYHVGCLKGKELVNKLEGHDRKRKWFCTKKCEKIYIGLHEILGKSFPLDANNLSWVILKSVKDDRGDTEESSDADQVRTECYRKLTVALGVMHECFEPINEPHTNSGLIEDLIFSKWSELNRLNFQGFYTMVLQRKDELISVATVRIHNEKVAEVPLIATRFEYRSEGMCRLLMNELEKKLVELGVERLVLPAASKLLNTWTNAFGFSKMTESERLKYLENTILDFQDTVMCEKLLRKMSSANQDYECIDFDRCSIDSGVTHENQIEESEVKQLQQNEECDEALCPDVLCNDFLEQESEIMELLQQEEESDKIDSDVIHEDQIEESEVKQLRQNEECDEMLCLDVLCNDLLEQSEIMELLQQEEESDKIDSDVIHEDQIEQSEVKQLHQNEECDKMLCLDVLCNDLLEQSEIMELLQQEEESDKIDSDVIHEDQTEQSESKQLQQNEECDRTLCPHVLCNDLLEQSEIMELLQQEEESDKIDSDVTHEDQIEQSEVKQLQQNEECNKMLCPDVLCNGFLEQSEIMELLQQGEESDNRMESLQPDQKDDEFWMDFLCCDVFNNDSLYFPSYNNNEM